MRPDRQSLRLVRGTPRRAGGTRLAGRRARGVGVASTLFRRRRRVAAIRVVVLGADQRRVEDADDPHRGFGPHAVPVLRKHDIDRARRQRVYRAGGDVLDRARSFEHQIGFDVMPVLQNIVGAGRHFHVRHAEPAPVVAQQVTHGADRAVGDGPVAVGAP